MVVALVIGRFQPFHIGHMLLIKEAAKGSDLVVIGIGSSQEGFTRDNPFTAEERRRMIVESLNSLKDRINYVVCFVPDINDNSRWVSHVEKLVPRFDVVYTNGELERRLFAEAGYRIHATGFFNRDRYSGTEIRRRILAGECWEDLVPEGTLKVMGEIGGVERIRCLK